MTVDPDTAWSNDVAAGTFWLTSVVGTFQDNENLQVSGATAAVADGVAVATTIPPGGRYEFRNRNFFGQAASLEMYGVNGVGKAFHFDGTQFVVISTGQPTDTPTHLNVHRNHLLLSYPGGSLIVSETGNPDGYSALRGAAELAVGQEVYALVHVGAGNTLIVGDDHMEALYGNDSGDFQLADHSDPQTGGVEWTVQNVGAPLYIDNRGVRRFDATDRYGNFTINTMTSDVQPWIDRQREAEECADQLHAGAVERPIPHVLRQRPGPRHLPGARRTGALVH